MFWPFCNLQSTIKIRRVACSGLKNMRRDIVGCMSKLLQIGSLSHFNLEFFFVKMSGISVKLIFLGSS